MLQSNAQPLTEASIDTLEDTYFEFQAEIGMTKHIGGSHATDELLKLCHVNEHSVVLDVGCGVGFTSCYIAEHHKARVVGVDIRPRMVERAREYAKQAELNPYIRFDVADAQELPMSDNVYDVVMCESVLAFIPDQKKALQEWIRVTKPGGFVGFTEAIWITPPPDDAKAEMDAYTASGVGVQASEAWEALLEQSGLENLIFHKYPLNMREDAVRQIRRIGLPRLIKAWGKTIKLLIKDAAYRKFLRNASKTPGTLMNHMGYGIYVGQVPK